MVFYDHNILPSTRLPRYLDLGLYAANSGIPFTISSNLVYALIAALRRRRTDREFSNLIELSKQIKINLLNMGGQIIGPEAHLSPAVITVALPPGIRSEKLGYNLEKAGYALSYRSQYLLERNWVQICLMGEYPQERITPFMQILQRHLRT
jgi:aspartate aminotransferase-like enzyme